jgi:hypothetical protein
MTRSRITFLHLTAVNIRETILSTHLGIRQKVQHLLLSIIPNYYLGLQFPAYKMYL